MFLISWKILCLLNCTLPKYLLNRNIWFVYVFTSQSLPIIFLQMIFPHTHHVSLHSNFEMLSLLYNNLLNSTKKDYIKNKIENAQSSKDLYQICDKLLNREQRSVLPSHDCATSLANTFVDYFKNKIELIRSNLEESLNTSTDQLPSTAPIFHGLSLEQFRVVSESDVRKVITSSPTKSCALDPIPTWLLKQCLDQVAPVLTVIVNTSLSCADFTPELKRAFVTPLIKKLILDCEIFKNYRPVSNLSFVSKLIERIICVQLVDHLKENGLYEIFQSAYRQLHSTETALLRVKMTYSKLWILTEEPY